MSAWRVYLGVARARFLLLAASCVVLAGVLAARDRPLDGGFVADLLLVLLGALSAHASVNALNEYSDFRSGLDLRTRRTPFSGGSGTLPACPQAAPVALWGGLCGLLLCALLGVFFLLQQPQSAMPILLLGLAGILLIVLYTPWLTRHPWLCLMAPGSGFGLLMLPAAVLALGGVADAGVWLCGLILCLFCNNLLLVNQLPDIDADRQSGRLTMPMLLGVGAVLNLVMLLWLLAYGICVLAVIAGWLPPGCLCLLAGSALAGWTWRRFRAGEPGCVETLPAMAGNVVLTLIAPVLLAVGLLMSSSW